MFHFGIFKTLQRFCRKMSAEVAKKAVDLGLLEEDDEFEEFPTKGKRNVFEKGSNSSKKIIFQNGMSKETRMTSTFGKTIGMTTPLRMIFPSSLGKRSHFSKDFLRFGRVLAFDTGQKWDFSL